MDLDRKKKLADIALRIFYNQCYGGSFTCGIGFGAFASRSSFLDFEDEDIQQVLDYCVEEGYFDVDDETYWITLRGKIRLQEIFEDMGEIKLIYFIKNQDISLSERILLFLDEMDETVDVGELYVTFHNFTNQEMIHTISKLIEEDLVEIITDPKLIISNQKCEEVYSIYGYKTLVITLNGKREANGLLKDPKILSFFKLPDLEDETRFEVIYKILDTLPRFHWSANLLEKHRRKNHPPFIINDEYDVQDLLFSYLLMTFDRVDVEDHGRKIAGVSTRSDIFLRDLKLIIEIKCFRTDDNWSAMKQNIDSKVQTYLQNENYDFMIIFIYNPDLALKNTSMIESELSTSQSINGKEFRVVAIVDPK